MIRVVFVCSGNICRSPMAEAVFRDLVAKAGLSQHFDIDSVGTGPWHIGETAHRGTLAVLRRHGIAHDGRARQIDHSDLSADYLLAMDRSHLSGIRRLGAADGRVDLFLKWAYEQGTVNTDEVPDPYYAGNFDEVYALVTRGCAALLDHIRRERRL